MIMIIFTEQLILQCIRRPTQNPEIGSLYEDPTETNVLGSSRCDGDCGNRTTRSTGMDVYEHSVSLGHLFNLRIIRVPK